MKDVLDFTFQINSVVISRGSALLPSAGPQKRTPFHRWQMENCGVVPYLSIRRNFSSTLAVQRLFLSQLDLD
jgi:hypothetical protein